MRTEFQLAKRYLFRGKARHISFIGVVSCVGVAVGVAALIIVISVMNGFDRELTERLLKFNYHITIESIGKDDLQAVKTDIAKIAHVQNAALFIQTQVFGKFDNYYLPLMVKGIEFSNPAEKKIFNSCLTKDFNNAGFYIGEGLARRFGSYDVIEYYPLDKKFVLKDEKIAGVFKVGVYDIDNNFLIADMEKAAGLSPNYLMFLGLRLDNPHLATQVKNEIKKRYGERLFVATWIESNQVLFSALALEKAVMFLILSLIILVASFNIFATVTVKVVEKTKDIGILKALGFNNKSIMLLFGIQGVMLGLTGVLWGAVLGVGLCMIIKVYPIIKLPESIYTIERLPVAISYGDIFIIMVLGVLFSLLSSLAPALRAAKLEPSEALRYE